MHTFFLYTTGGRCMAVTHDFETFVRIFSENLERRSRTAKGISETSVNPAKKPLLKSGKELKKQVAKNTEKLIRFVWECGTPFEVGDKINSGYIRKFCEKCDQIINFKLTDFLQYEKEILFLRRKAYSLSHLMGLSDLSYSVNAAYRVWNVSYCGVEIPLCKLEEAMENFYEKIETTIEIPGYIYAFSDHMRMIKIPELHSKKHGAQKRILAFVDHMMDGVIHPWADGCGRNATALVMWLSLLPGYKLPIFGSREEHYASLCDLDAHTEYFGRCLERTVSE